MGRTLDRTVQIGVVLVTALLVFNAVLAYRNIRQLDDDAKWVSHTQETLAATDAAMLALVDAETGERGYLLTGQDDYLQPYVAALPRLSESLARLDAAATHTSLHERVLQLKEMADQRQELLKERIERRRQHARDREALAAGAKGKEQMDAIRGLVAEIKSTQQSLRADRERRRRAAYATAVSTGLITDTLGLVAVGAFVWLVNRSAAARQHAAARVREQRQWLQVTLSSIGDAVIATDIDGRIVFLNPVAGALTGWSQEEAVQQPLDKVFRIFNEDTRLPVDSPVHKVLRDGTVAGLANHTMLIARDGSERPIDDSAAPIRDDEGHIHGVVLIFRDVTERRRAADIQRRLAAIVESSDDAIVGKSLDGLITSWNEGAERLYGYAADEIIGRPFSVLIPPDRPEEVAATVARLRRGERAEHFETVRRRKDGRLIDVAVSYSPIKDADGRLVGTSVISRDITERARAAAALRESEQRFAGFMHHLPGLAWIKDLRGRYVFANDAAERAFRHARAELYGKTDDELFPEETARQFRENDHRALESDAGVQVIETLEHDDGVVHYSVVSKFPIPD